MYGLATDQSVIHNNIESVRVFCFSFTARLSNRRPTHRQ